MSTCGVGYGCNVVPLCGRKVIKKRSSKNVSKLVFTRHGQKKVANLVPTKCDHRKNVGQILFSKKHVSNFLAFFLTSESGRRPITSFPPTSFFARDDKRSAGTTLLPHMVTSLQPLRRYFVERALAAPN